MAFRLDAASTWHKLTDISGEDYLENCKCPQFFSFGLASSMCLFVHEELGPSEKPFIYFAILRCPKNRLIVGGYNPIRFASIDEL